MANDRFNNIGRGGTVAEGVFVRFPDLIPALGEHFWREDGQHGKLLLIGESNYFDDNDAEHSDFRDAERWYKAGDARLIPDYRKTDVGNYISYPTFNKVFDIMDRVLDEAGIEHEAGLSEAAFYNYYLRPAYNDGRRKGFRPQPIDDEVSGEALSGIIGEIKPDVIIFLSKLAYTAFGNYCKAKELAFHDVVIELVKHPASWRWEANGVARNKARIAQLLREHWVRHQADKIARHNLVIAIGGGGCNIAASLSGQLPEGTELAMLDTDADSLARHGDKARTITLQGSQAEQEAALRDLITKDTGKVVVVATLGGETGTRLVPTVLRIAKETPRVTGCVVTIPFDFEGRECVDKSLEVLEEIKRLANDTLVIDNDRLKDKHPDRNFTDGFKACDAEAATYILKLLRQ